MGAERVRHRHGVAGCHGLHHGAPMPFQYLPPSASCTQDEKLRAKFTGTPEKVRQSLHLHRRGSARDSFRALGFRKLEEVIGRTDLLYQMSRGAEELDGSRSQRLARPGRSRWPRASLDADGPQRKCPTRWTHRSNTMRSRCSTHGEKMQLAYNVRNTMRSIGARISSRNRAQNGG